MRSVLEKQMVRRTNRLIPGPQIDVLALDFLRVLLTLTVCFDITSLMVYTYGHDDGKNGPTRCALIGFMAAFGDMLLWNIQ
jgi:hypothetical protein